MHLKNLFATAFAAILIPATLSAGPYIKIGSIEGEFTPGAQTVAGHEGQIEILSWSWGESRTRSANDRVPGSATEMFNPREIIIVKAIDKATPKLAEARAKSTVFPEITVSDEKGTLKLTKAVISGIETKDGKEHLRLRLVSWSQEQPRPAPGNAARAPRRAER